MTLVDLSKLFVLLFCFSAHGCSGQPAMEAIRIIQPFPLIDQNGNLTGYDTISVDVFYYGNLTVYSFPYTVEEKDKNGASVSNTLAEYFVIASDSTNGYYYNFNGKELVSKRMLADSFFIENTWITQIYGYHAFKDNAMILTDSRYDSVNQTLHEIYSFHARNDTTAKGIAHYYYDKKMRDIKYSLSSELDSIHGMKLYYSRIIHAPWKMKEKGFNIGAYETTYKIERIAILNESEILSVLRMYKKDTSSSE